MKKFMILIIFGVLIFGGIYLYNNNEDFKNISNNVTNKQLDTTDVILDVKQSLTAVSITVTPIVDIKDICIEYEVFGSGNTVLKSGKLNKTNLYKGQTYEYDLKLSFTQLLKVTSVRYRMTSGTKK